MKRFILQWHITERCNLRCTHCYQNKEIIKNELNLQEKYSVVDKFLSFIKKLNSSFATKGIINLTGGEPFSYRDLELLLKYIYQYKEYIIVNFLSNGTIINNKTIKLLNKYPPRFVQVSIDGDKETHNQIRGEGAFEKAIDGIQKLKENNIRVLISFTAHKQNYKEFPKVVKLANQLNVNKVWTDRLIPEGVGMGLKDELLNKHETFKYITIIKKEQIKNRLNPFVKTKVAPSRPLQFIPFLERPQRCGAGKNLFALLPNGVLLPCRRLPIEIGNIKNSTFEEIYNHNQLVKELQTKRDIKGCEYCLFKKTCDGGLRCLAYAYTGSPFTRDPNCWMR